MTDYTQRIDEIRLLESARRNELVAQTLLMGIGVVVMWVQLDLWQLPVWFLIFYGLVWLEQWFYRRPVKRYSRGLYLRLLGLSFTIALGTCFLPVFLWQQEGEVFKFAALAFMAGAALNTYLVRTRSWPILLSYLIPNIATYVIIAVTILMRSADPVAGGVALLVAALMAFYFVVAVADSLQRNQRHAKAQEELYQAQKMETVGNLAGGIAHDFNNLLGVVSANLEMLHTADREGERRELVAQSQVAAERGAALARQLLAFGRQSHLAPEDVSLKSMCRELSNMLRRLLPEYIEVEITCDDRLDRIWADKSALQSTLVNLALNARDAMTSAGKLRITVDLAEVGPKGQPVCSGVLNEGRYVRFTVGDTGAGISPDLFGKVLEPFYTTKEVGKGSGLGLSMAAGFARQSRGGVHLESEPDQGTTVALFIPYESRDPETPTVKEDRNMTVSEAPAQRRILLVEDEMLLRSVIAKHLETEGFVICSAENADKAMEAIEDGFVPDVVLTDIVMPGEMHGVALVKELSPRFPEARYIVMTGYAFSRDMELASSGLNYTMISKPFKLRDLSEHLNGTAVAEEA